MQTAMAHHHVPFDPDMILPYDFDKTSSPTAQDLRRPWQASDLDFSIGPALSQIGPLTPTTPIIYGNGTMLSDIGEVTEAESTPGQRTRPEEIRGTTRSRDLALNSSPTTGYNAVMKRTRGGTHERKVSVESTSTVTSHGQSAELFQDFDDSISIDDSNFQGDDEESIFGDGSELANRFLQSRSLMRKDSSIGQDEDRHSSAALSRRAELILANAKKRLDKMEGNLERARTSLYITPSSSMTSISSSSPLARSTPSPPQRLVTQLGVPPSRHRTLQNPASPGHSRVFSENNVPSSMSTNRYFVRSTSAADGDRLPPSKAATRYPVRSASAAAVLRATTTSSIAADGSQISPNYNSSLSLNSPPYATSLEPLSEDDTISNLNSSRTTSIAESHFSSVGEPRALTRSISSMQMRDLRDQMKDLKGKISSLRDRAREENMRRRSLQSLRTPSPFTAAEQWYTQGAAYDETMNHSNHESVPTTWNSEAKAAVVVQPVKIDEFQGRSSFDTAPSIYEDVQENLTPEYAIEEENSTLAVQNAGRQIEVTSREDTYDLEAEDANDTNDMDTEHGSDYGDEVVDYDELDGYPSESEASHYHESLETPVSHEDREDAFDYQNYFLHSAMGNLSRQRDRRDSFDSYDSEDSVETARGVIPPSSIPKNESISVSAPAHERKASGDSISTLATFATASEGREGDESPDFDDYPMQTVQAPTSRSSTPSTAKHDAFLGDVSREQEVAVSATPSPLASTFPIPLKLAASARSPNLAIRGKQASTRGILKHTYNQPSVSSFSSSTGTTRSFPLVKSKTPTQTPSPIPENERVNSKDNPILSEPPRGHGLASPIASAIEVDRRGDGESPDSERTSAREESPVNMLAKEDQVLVERVVASLGKCVLAMQEVSRGSTEGRMWRRRLDIARSVLEGTSEGSL